MSDEKERQSYQPSPVVQLVNDLYKAAAGYEEQHRKWITDCKIAATLGSPRPEEPQQSEAAKRGERLQEVYEASRVKIGEAIDRELEGKPLDTRIVIEEMRLIEDSEERVASASGIVAALAGRTNEARWDDLAETIAICPEALGFGVAGAIIEGAGQEIRAKGKIKASGGMIAVLEAISGESSLLEEAKKDEARLYANEGKGMKVFKAVLANRILFVDRDRLVMLLGWGKKENIPETAIAALFAGSTTFDQNSFPEAVARLSQTAEVELEDREYLRGITLGYVEAMLNSRPSAREGEAVNPEYLKTSRAAAKALLGLMPPEESFLRYCGQYDAKMGSRVVWEEVKKLYAGCKTNEVKSMMNRQHSEIMDKESAARRLVEVEQAAAAKRVADEAAAAQDLTTQIQQIVPPVAVEQPLVEDTVPVAAPPVVEKKKVEFWSKLLGRK